MSLSEIAAELERARRLNERDARYSLARPVGRNRRGGREGPTPASSSATARAPIARKADGGIAYSRLIHLRRVRRIAANIAKLPDLLRKS